MRTCNYAVALLTAIIGACIAWTSYGYGIGMSMFGPGSGFWPFILGAALVLIAALIVFDTARHSRQYAEEKIILTAPANVSAYKMMAMILVYIILLKIIGFYPSSLLFLIAAMHHLGLRRPKMILAVSLGFLAVLYILFSILLNLSLPLPFFWE